MASMIQLAREGYRYRTWYHHAESEVYRTAECIGTDPKRLADLLSVFSPRVSVLRSIRFTLHYLRTGAYRKDCTRSVRAAVDHYERTGEIRGPKTGAFAKALTGDQSAVVLDTWMAKALSVDQSEFARKSGYRYHSCRIRRVAYRLGWTPAETQAAIWAATVQRHGRTVAFLSLADHVSLWELPE